MSMTMVKTDYFEMGPYGSNEKRTLYCEHHHGSDTVTFYDEDGRVSALAFESWMGDGVNDKWDAVQRLWMPYKGEWYGELKDGVEYYHERPWERG